MAWAGERLLRGLWAGCLWTVGYLVAPTLFAVLEDRALAGRLAGEMFTAATLVSLAIAVLLGGLYLRAGPPARGRLLLVVLAVGVLAANEWLLRPAMAQARLPDGTPGEAFGMLHGVSAGLWLLASLLTLFLAALGPPRVRPEGD